MKHTLSMFLIRAPSQNFATLTPGGTGNEARPDTTGALMSTCARGPAGEGSVAG
jgi:hypothetical protein